MPRAVSSEELGDATRVIRCTAAAEALREGDGLSPSPAADREAAQQFPHQRAPSADPDVGRHAEGGGVLARSHQGAGAALSVRILLGI